MDRLTHYTAATSTWMFYGKLLLLAVGYLGGITALAYGIFHHKSVAVYAVIDIPGTFLIMTVGMLYLLNDLLYGSQDGSTDTPPH